mmetsp:Transcript_19777/g.30504  ORF Transcript_19777/g.30504 Transcript_19777/m.30504 type:complete len:104 (+) Transcript_19777:3-314(+)
MWLTLFFLNWALNILAIEFLGLRKLKKIINVDEARDSRYPPFRRTDTAWMNRPWLFLTCHFCLAKVIFAILSCILCGVGNIIVSIGHPPGEPITGLRYQLIRF